LVKKWGGIGSSRERVLATPRSSYVPPSFVRERGPAGKGREWGGWGVVRRTLNLRHPETGLFRHERSKHDARRR